MDCHQPFTSFIQMWLATVGVLSVPFIVSWLVNGMKIWWWEDPSHVRPTKEEMDEAFKDYRLLKGVVERRVLSEKEIGTAEVNVKALQEYLRAFPPQTSEELTLEDIIRAEEYAKSLEIE